MPSYFVARLLEDEVVREHKNLYGKGISPHYNANKDVVQISFENHTLEDAQTWLKEHEFPDVEIIDDAPVEAHSRNFGYPFTDIGGKFEKTPEGGLRVRGVKLLAAGTWTDSAQKTPCEYSPDVLRKFAANWQDNAIWSRHFGGVPRNITEKVGIVENPRYESDAVVGDLHYHGLTQQSRDTINMIENGLANYVSVETISKDKWNVGKKAYTADEIGFTGLATVNQGACRVCKIRESESIGESESAGESESPAEDKELAASVPNNPPGDEVGDDASQCRLTLADFTDKQWSDLTQEEKSSIATHFAFNSGEDSFGALKLPHHDPKTGDVRPNCVRAALQAIGGARSGTPMNLGGKEEAVKSHLNAHMADINKEMEEAAPPTVEEQQDSTMETKELEDLVAAQAETIKELAAKIEAIEKTPVPNTLAESATVKEYEYAPYQVEFKNNIIRRRQ